MIRLWPSASGILRYWQMRMARPNSLRSTRRSIRTGMDRCSSLSRSLGKHVEHFKDPLSGTPVILPGPGYSSSHSDSTTTKSYSDITGTATASPPRATVTSQGQLQLHHQELQWHHRDSYSSISKSYNDITGTATVASASFTVIS